MKKQLGYRKIVEAELDTLPLMGLFVVLIPMLLLSAVFLEITVIELNLPDELAAEMEQEAERLSLSVEIGEAVFVVRARGVEETVISRDDDNAGERLLAELSSITTRHPENRIVTIVSQPTTRYEDIIYVMDVSRAAGLPHTSLMGSNL